jgi:shikimate dehydrogenase
MGTPYAEVIGDPIAHSKSPLIHKFWLEKLGIEGEFRATRVRLEELDSYFAARRQDSAWCGCSVTMPLKKAVPSHLHHNLDKQVGAVNCVIPDGNSLVGLNTDVSGVRETLEKRVGKRHPVCLIGTGSAARAAVAGLMLLKVAKLNVVARQHFEGERLLADFRFEGRVFDFDEAESALRDACGVINATPLGMTGFSSMPHPMIEALGGIRPRGFVFDMVYNPLQTDLLSAATRLGLLTIDGLEMLVAQAAEAFGTIFGAIAPREHDPELRKLLTR